MDPRAFNPCTCGNAVIAFESDALPGGGATASARCRACGRSVGPVTADNLAKCSRKVLAAWNHKNPCLNNVCEICGRPFHGLKYCSPECRRIAKNDSSASSRAKAGARVSGFVELVATHTTSLNAIMRAKTRPLGCSPQRWRMELRRRAKMAQFGGSEKARSIYDFNTLPAEYCR